MVFSIVLTTEEGSTIVVCKTDREDISAEVGTPQMISRLMKKMAGDDGVVEIVNVTEVEL